jgi:hypothetical protein
LNGGKVILLVDVFPSGLWQEYLFHNFVLPVTINAFVKKVGGQDSSCDQLQNHVQAVGNFV